MTELLTLPQARDALGWMPGSHTSDEADLSSTYIPAVTRIVEEWCGRMVDRRETWYSDDASPITTPWVSGVVKIVACSVGHFSDWEFTAPILTVTDLDYTPGVRLRIVATSLPTPTPVVIVAKRILSRLWNADHQGTGGARPDGTASPTDLTEEDLLLLQPYRTLGGFA